MPLVNGSPFVVSLVLQHVQLCILLILENKNNQDLIILIIFKLKNWRLRVLHNVATANQGFVLNW